MPLRPEIRHHYGRQWLQETRPRILARAGNKCEQCGKPNGALVISAPRGYWCPAFDFHPWYNQHGVEVRNEAFEAQLDELYIWPEYLIQVRVTIAHLNHVSGDDRDENLRALCQRCHLDYDKEHHRATRCDRKDAARPLLHGDEEVQPTDGAATPTT